MNWHEHYAFKKTHSFLSPSRPHWIRYDSEKLGLVFENRQKAALGSALHALAENMIKLSIKVLDDGSAFSRYVNDAIDLSMKPEQLLFYSENIYGTADAISFLDNTLRIHDLKTGTSEGSIEQLHVYCALFCLEYRISPNQISIVCRIYHENGVMEWCPTKTEILILMGKIEFLDETIENLKRGNDGRQSR